MITSLLPILDKYDCPAIVEHDDGTWSHSPEYIALRYGGIEGLVSYLKEQEVDRA